MLDVMWCVHSAFRRILLAPDRPEGRPASTMLRRVSGTLFAVDLLTIAYVSALAAFTVWCAPLIPGWRLVAACSAGVMIGLPVLAAARLRWDSPGLVFLHDWAFAPLAYATYLMMHEVVGPVRGGWLADPFLIAADRAILGMDAATVLAPLARPWLTELLQLAYTSFYALMVAVGAELYWRRDRRAFHAYAFACALGFFVSFLGYLAVPAVGPRFTIFDVPTVSRDLPGLWMTDGLRAFVDGGGLVSPGLSKAAAAAAAPRDVFPSGHTMMTVIAMFWAWRCRLKIRGAVWLVGALLVMATMYLRYHYAVDVVAGVLFAAACVASTPLTYRAFASVSREEGSSFT
jgi:membrane-associated phospholipid phosphatase